MAGLKCHSFLTVSAETDYKNTMERIEKKRLNAEELSYDELLFIYMLDKDFNQIVDTRLKIYKNKLEFIITQRDIIADLSRLTGFSQNEIGVTGWNEFGPRVKYFYGDLNNLNAKSSDKITDQVIFPEHVSGNVSLGMIESSDNIVLPKKIGGSLGLESLTDTRGLMLPEDIARDLFLSNLRHIAADGLRIFNVRGTLYLDRLKDSTNLVIPDSHDRDRIYNAEGLNF